MGGGGIWIDDFLLIIFDLFDFAEATETGWRGFYRNILWDFCLTCGGCGGECLFRRIQKAEYRRQKPGERIQAVREKAMRGSWKEGPKACVSGNHMNGS